MHLICGINFWGWNIEAGKLNFHKIVLDTLMGIKFLDDAWTKIDEGGELIDVICDFDLQWGGVTTVELAICFQNFTGLWNVLLNSTKLPLKHHFCENHCCSIFHQVPQKIKVLDYCTRGPAIMHWIWIFALLISNSRLQYLGCDSGSSLITE